jgi:predicted deacylase
MQVQTIFLAKRRINISLEIIKGKSSGRTIVITGGMDGDEYASIDACYELISQLKSEKIQGTVIIVPIVNMPGFESLRSYNPQDNKYPKQIYPGKAKGTQTEVIIDWLNKNYIEKSNFWIDLHGGALNEYLEPYIYLYETGNREMDEVNEKIIRESPIEKIIYRKKGAWKKTQTLGKKKIGYTMIEAGCSGNRNKKWVDVHVNAVKSILRVLGNLPEENSEKQRIKKRVYTKTSVYATKKSGLWYPNFPKDGFVKKGDSLGELRTLKQERLGKIIAGEDGEWLYFIEGLYVKRGDILAEIGHTMFVDS